MRTMLDNEFSSDSAMKNFKPILLIFASALIFDAVIGHENQGIGEEKINEDVIDRPKFPIRVVRQDEGDILDKHKELEQLRVPSSTLVEDMTEIAKHISKESSTHEEMKMDESLGQERIYNIHLHKPSIPPKRQVDPTSGILAELDGQLCAEEAIRFGHDLEAAEISHELLCEVRKLSQYFAIAQANLQEEIARNSPKALSEEYIALAAEERLVNLLENGVPLSEDATLIIPSGIPSTVPVTNIQGSSIKIRYALERLGVHFENVVVRTLGEHPELLEQLRQQLLEVENTLTQLQPDYENLVNQLGQSTRAVYQGYIAAAANAPEPIGTIVNSPPTTSYSSASTFADQHVESAPQAVTASIINGQPVNPFINTRLLKRALKKIVKHVIRNFNVEPIQTSTSGSPGATDGNTQLRYPFINEGFYGSILKHIIKHLEVEPSTPVSAGTENLPVDPLINTRFLGGSWGHHHLPTHYPIHLHPIFHYPIHHYPYYPYVLATEPEDPNSPFINESKWTSVLKHIIKHLDFVPISPGVADGSIDDSIVNENLVGSVLRHLAHRFHEYSEGNYPETKPSFIPPPPLVHPTPLPFPPVSNTPPLVHPSPLPFPPVSNTPPLVQPSPLPFPRVSTTPTPYVNPSRVPSYPLSSGTTYSQSSSSSYTAGSASSSSTLTGTSPIAQLPIAPQVGVSQNTNLYPRPLPSSSGSTYSYSSSSSYTPQSASSSNTATSAGFPGNPLATKSVASSSSYTPGSASSSSTLTGTSGSSSNILYPHAYYTGPLIPLPPLTSSSDSLPSFNYPGSLSSDSNPPAFANQGTSDVYGARLRGKPVVVPANSGTYSSSSSNSYTPVSASSSTTTTSGDSSHQGFRPFPRGPVQTAPITTGHYKIPQTYPSQQSQHTGTFSTGSSSSYTSGSASSSSTQTGVSPSRTPVVSGTSSYIPQVQPTSSQTGTFSTDSSPNFNPNLYPGRPLGAQSQSPSFGEQSSSLTSQNHGSSTSAKYGIHSDSVSSGSDVVSSSTVVKSKGSSTPLNARPRLPPTPTVSTQKQSGGSSVNLHGYETANATLIFPQDKVATALGRKTLAQGDVVVISVKSGIFLLGRVVDEVTPIKFRLSYPLPPVASIRREGRLWRLRARDFQDAHCRSQLDHLLDIINRQTIN